MIKRLKTITLLINIKAIVVASLAVLSTYLCLYWSISANFPLTLIATAIVFPIVFSINSAYKRREMALDDYASLKSHGRAIYYATRDWLDDSDATKQDRCRKSLGRLLRSTREMFSAPRSEMHEHFTVPTLPTWAETSRAASFT